LSSPLAGTDPMRLPDMPLHDPFIVADEKTRTYYLYTSNDPSVSGVDGTGTMVYRSQDLRDWTRPAVVFLAAGQDGNWATDGGWAPEVHEWRGRYYLFTTLHDDNKPLPLPPAGRWGTPFQIPNHMRGTVIAVSDSLLGPFTVVDPSRPTPPEHLMTLDGTLYVDPSGQPWMVYAHEWLQTIDGTMEAIRLAPEPSESRSSCSRARTRPGSASRSPAAYRIRSRRTSPTVRRCTAPLTGPCSCCGRRTRRTRQAGTAL
jgi:hypothetical protein